MSVPAQKWAQWAQIGNRSRRCDRSERRHMPRLFLGALILLVGVAHHSQAAPFIKETLQEVDEDIEFGPRMPAAPVEVSVSPIILIPGIGGSVMVERRTGMRVWIRFYEATYYFQRFMWGKYNSTTETMEPLPGQPETIPLLSGFGLDAIRNLDPAVHWPVYDFLVYFDGMIKVLEQQGWVAGKTLFGAPWDFRQSMCWEPTIEMLKNTILTAHNTNNRKVSLVTHSMGGLVTKCLLAKHPEVFEQYVEAWVSIATPHQGAAGKILLEFLQGYNLGNIVVKAEDAKCLSLEAPSVYELLPQEGYDWRHPPYTAMNMSGQRRVFAVDKTNATGYIVPLREALRTHTRFLPPDKTEDLEPFNDHLFERSRGTRKLVAEAQLPPSVRFYNVYGVNVSTPLGLEFDEIQAWADLAHKKYREFTVDGDGTVPVESATQHGYTERASLAVQSKHLALVQQKATIEMVLKAVRDTSDGAASAPPPVAS